MISPKNKYIEHAFGVMLLPILPEKPFRSKTCLDEFSTRISDIIKNHFSRRITLQYDFNQLPSRRETESIKWNAYPSDVLPMWVADMDFVSPEPVIQALHERVAHGVFGYPGSISPSSHQAQDIRAILADRLMRLYHWKVEVDDICLIPGVVTGLNMATHALVPAGGGVLVQTPVYPPFLSVAKNAGLLHQEMELTRQTDGSYVIDFDAFEAAIDSQTRLFILCNPHNPVGRVFRPDELQHMAEICLRRGIYICSDEIHCDLVYSGYQHTPIAKLSPEIAENTITLMAPSKTYNLAGLEFSFAVVQNRELRQKLLQAGPGLVGWVNLMGLTAARAAYLSGQEWLDQLLPYLEDNRNELDEYVRRELPGIQLHKPEGTYLAWLDCRGLDLPEKPYDFFLKQAHVAFNDGATFGRGGAGFIRLNFGCPRSMLLEALERVKAALEHHSS